MESHVLLLRQIRVVDRRHRSIRFRLWLSTTKTTAPAASCPGLLNSDPVVCAHISSEYHAVFFEHSSTYLTPIPSHPQNVTCENMEIRNFDGDAMVVRNSNMVNIDARNYDQ